MTEIYLDHNATTPLAIEAAEAMLACQREVWGNPASQHRVGRRARQLLEEAREGIAALLGANLQSATPDQLVFTSGGTEANNLALLGLCCAHPQPGRLVVSAIEHPSVTAPAVEMSRRGWELAYAPVTADGVLELAWLIQECNARASRSRSRTPEPLVVSIMLGNNETGVLQPLPEISRLCRAVGARLHTDAVQVAGKLPVDFRALDVDALSISAHKFHGPRGIGALLFRQGVNLAPQMFGGFQQAGVRPGTEAVELAVGMHAALRVAVQQQQQRAAHMMHLREALERDLTAGYPGATVHGASAPRLPHTTNISFPGLDRQALQMALDLAGVCCSTGSACASGSTDPSPVLLAMHCKDADVHSSLRLSLGVQNTAADVQEAVRRILNVCKDLGSQNQARNLSRMGRNPA